jgi:hypothetical protein
MLHESRRQFLRGAAGTCLSLPFFSSLEAKKKINKKKNQREERHERLEGKIPQAKRFLLVHTHLGYYLPEFIPKKIGEAHGGSRLLKPLKKFEDRFTVFSGLEHAEALRGHSAAMAFTSGLHPAHHLGKQHISIDQRIAEEYGDETRLDSLSLECGAGGASYGLSFSRTGARRSVYKNAGDAFYEVFTEKDKSNSQFELLLQKSILDDVHRDIKSLESKLNHGDKHKFDEYLSSVRDLERKIQKTRKWEREPFPKVKRDFESRYSRVTDMMSIMPDMYEIIKLCFETDITRIITLQIPGTNKVLRMDGIRDNYHGLTHHGMQPDKMEQLLKIETEFIVQFSKLIEYLSKAKDENGLPLIDSTTILFGSGMGNANSHDCRNLPIIVAGGGFDHGKHLHFDQKVTKMPLCNLYLSILRSFGIQDDYFGDSYDVLPGFS